MKPSKRFLLINFDFPPNQGIGGRRWAKLAKALANAGHDIYVVKASPIEGNITSTWDADVCNDRIHVQSVARTYPTSLSHPQQGLLGKIRFRISRMLLLAREKGTIYDQSIGWDHVMLDACRKLIRDHDIQHIIATGAPWNLLVYAARLKSEFHGCTLLVDYRDPWLTAKNYGMSALSAERMKAEIAKQRFVFEHADWVTTPYPYLTDALRQWSAEFAAHQPNFSTLTHFYDPDDLVASNEANSRQQMQLIYAGDFYAGIESVFQRFIESLRALHDARPDIYNRLRITMYCSASVPEHLLSEPCLTVKKNAGKKVFQEIAQSDACLVFLPHHKKDELTTKFAEYIPTGKAILVWADEGYASRFVKENQLGFHMGQDISQWIAYYDAWRNGRSFCASREVTQAFALNEIAEQLIRLLH